MEDERSRIEKLLHDALEGAAHGRPLTKQERDALALMAPYAADIVAAAQGRRFIVNLGKVVLFLAAMLGALVAVKDYLLAWFAR